MSRVRHIKEKSGAHVGGPKPGASRWAQAGPKWVGPRRAQVCGLKPGPSGWAQARNLGPQQIQKINILEIKIRVAQNVGKVWISRGKKVPASFGAISGNLFHGPEKMQNIEIFSPIFLVGPMGPIHPI